MADSSKRPRGSAAYENEREDDDFDLDYVIAGGFDTEVQVQEQKEGFWNFKKPNTISYSRKVVINAQWPPNCELELNRARLVLELRRTFNSMVEARLHIQPPSETFNRWIFDQLTSSRSNDTDQLLPDIEKEMTTGVLYTQLVENMPGSSYVSWLARSDARNIVKIIKQYLEACRSWMKTPSSVLTELLSQLSDDDRNRRDYTFNKRKYACNNPREVTWLLDDVKKYFGEAAVSESKPAVLTCVSDFIKTSKSKISELTGMPSDIHATCKRVEGAEYYDVTYRDDTVSCSCLHHDKLKQLYEIHTKSRDPSLDLFYDALYVLLRRYRTFFGTDVREGEGSTFHAAAPETVFQLLSDRLSVCMEGFASPLNCYYSTFCSAFPDIDGLFGSQGSFFDLEPVEGSMEVGPPYTLEVMDRTADLLIKHLEHSTRPLSFIVFVPEWRKPVAHYHDVMDKTKYMRWFYKAHGRQHAYVRGDQHIVRGTESKTNRRKRELDEPSDRFFNLPFETAVYVLQNEAGANKWPITDEFKDKLADALKVHVKESH